MSADTQKVDGKREKINGYRLMKMLQYRLNDVVFVNRKKKFSANTEPKKNEWQS